LNDINLQLSYNKLDELSDKIQIRSCDLIEKHYPQEDGIVIRIMCVDDNIQSTSNQLEGVLDTQHNQVDKNNYKNYIIISAIVVILSIVIYYLWNF
jgi:putative IMPACT (imprinted ancient) family translation regulator